MDTLSPFGDRQLVLFDDAPVATPEPADIELSEEVKASIRTMFKAGRMQGTLLTMFKINRTTLTNILADCIDSDAGPDDDELDRIFGIHTRPPTASPDECGDAATSQKPTATATA